MRSMTLIPEQEQRIEFHRAARIASELGFTPASRSRISAPPPAQLPLLDLTEDDYAEERPEGGG